MEGQYPKRQKFTSQPVAATAISEVTEEGDEVVDDTTEVVDTVADNESDASMLYEWATIVFEGHLEHIELYDSGASRHISPFKEDFIAYWHTSPRSITAADSCIFNAVGVGDLWIDIPNHPKLMRMLLKDVLYAPNIRLTIVSTRCIMRAGYSIHMEDEECVIKRKGGEPVGIIKANASGLFKVNHTYATATIADQSQLIDLLTLHRRLGHIAYDKI